MSPSSSPSPPEKKYYSTPPCVENTNEYRPGGFHPVHLGDKFKDGRYEVVHKLGYGGCATIWLVRDTILNRFVALKISMAFLSKDCDERAIVRRLMNTGEAHPNVIQIFDEFEHAGINGIHQCIVSEILGPRLSDDVIEDICIGSGLPRDALKRVVVQVASAVAYLHRHDVVHADLHLSNLLFYHSSFASWNEDDVQYYLRKPRRGVPRYSDTFEPAPPNPHVPTYFVPCESNTERLLRLCLGLERELPGAEDELPVRGKPNAILIVVKLCDFGESFLAPRDLPPITRESHCPIIYRSPEIIFDGVQSRSCDIWALAVLFHRIFAGAGIEAKGLFPSYHHIQNQVIANMVLCLGKLPQNWWDSWSDRYQYFNDDGVWIGDLNEKKKNERLVKLRLCEKVRNELEEVVRGMVKYTPEERLDAEQVERLVTKLWAG